MTIDTATQATTAFPGYSGLYEACRRGYCPTLVIRTRAQQGPIMAVRAQLEADGIRHWGSDQDRY